EVILMLEFLPCGGERGGGARTSGCWWGRSCPRRNVERTNAVGPPRPIELASRVFCGFCKPVLLGVSCRRSFLLLPPVGGDCNSGKRKGFGWKPGEHCWGLWTRRACSSGTKPSWTAALLRRKRGLLRWQNQAWQGHKVDGIGRR